MLDQSKNDFISICKPGEAQSFWGGLWILVHGKTVNSSRLPSSLWADLWNPVTLLESNTAPRAREASASAVRGQTHNPAQTVTESVYYHRGNQEPMHGSLGSVCDGGEGTAGGNPIGHVWAASVRQVCSVQERWSLGLCVCMAQGGGP